MTDAGRAAGNRCRQWLGRQTHVAEHAIRLDGRCGVGARRQVTIDVDPVGAQQEAIGRVVEVEHAELARDSRVVELDRNVAELAVRARGVERRGDNRRAQRRRVGTGRDRQIEAREQLARRELVQSGSPRQCQRIARGRDVELTVRGEPIGCKFDRVERRCAPARVVIEVRAEPKLAELGRAEPRRQQVAEQRAEQAVVEAAHRDGPADLARGADVVDA